MENRSHALMAGLFTVLFFFAAALALWWLGGSRELTDTYRLETRGNVTGLNVEAQVRYRGIRAGKVTRIAPDPLDPATLLVEISLGRQYRLSDKTVATLGYQGITGLAYVMLEDGPAGSRPLLDSAGTPPRIRIQPGLFDKLGNQAGDIATQVAELTVRLNRLLDDRNTQNIARTLDNLAQASEGLKAAPMLMAELRAAVHTVFSATNLQHLQAILAHLEKTAGAAAPLTAETRALVATLNGLAQRLERVAVSAGGVGERLNDDTLPRAAVLLTELTAATHRLDRLLDTLNDNPQAMLFGAPSPLPGPGEAGFTAPQEK